MFEKPPAFVRLMCQGQVSGGFTADVIKMVIAFEHGTFLYNEIAMQRDQPLCVVTERVEQVITALESAMRGSTGVKLTSPDPEAAGGEQVGFLTGQRPS